MNADKISVISVQESACNEEMKENRKIEKKLASKDVIKIFCHSGLGIIVFCVIFAIPRLTVPRTNSIIYQSYWIEALLPSIINIGVISGNDFFQLTTWFQEKELSSFFIYLKIFFMRVIPYTLLYISSYAIWSVYLGYNHPMPNLGLIMAPTFIINAIGLWFILPSHLLAKKDFRQKLKTYLFFVVWVQLKFIETEILSNLFIKTSNGYQFLVPLVVASSREIDKRVKSKMVTKMMGVQDEPAAALVAINVSTIYSFLIAVRLVGAELATICCTFAIDFILHAKMTYGIIRERKRIMDVGIENVWPGMNRKITMLILAELIEGFTPIIYGVCMAMAYYGPNAHILSNVGNSYWGKPIKTLGPLFATMSILFAVDTLSVAINSFCLWKIIKVDMFQEFCRVLSRYKFFMAINLAQKMVLCFGSTDINYGIDVTRSFQWISDEGWRNLVNNSSDITPEEKAMLIAEKNFL